MGETTFRKVQVGIESPAAHGTPVTAVRMYDGGALKVPVDRVTKFPQQIYGSRIQAHRNVVYQIGLSGMELGLTDPCFQDMLAWLAIGLKGAVTGAEQTTGQGDDLFDFTPSLTASNTPDSATIEYGDDSWQAQIPYVMASEYIWDIPVGTDSPVDFKTKLFGQQIIQHAFTAINQPAASKQDAMIGNMCKFWLNNTWATLGTTQISDMLRKATVDLTTGLRPKRNGAGSKVYTQHGEGFVGGKITFVFEGNAHAVTEMLNFQTGVERAIRLQVLGNQIGTGTNHCLQWDVFGAWASFVPLDSDADGDDLSAAVFNFSGDRLTTEHAVGVKLTTNQTTIP